MLEDEEMLSHRPWRKILYEKQLYPDNYVDSQRFLDQLDTSTRVSKLSLQFILLSASVLAQQLTIVTIFLTIYKYIVRRRESVWRILYFDILLLTCGYLIHFKYDTSCPTIGKALYSFVTFGICLRVISPVLQTLTSSYSSDTIHALTIIFSSLHLVFYDYAFYSNESTAFSGVLSLNAAMFTSVLLASRLEDIDMVAAFILLAVILFSLFPNAVKLIKLRSTSSHIVLCLMLWVLASTMLFFLDITLLIAYEVLMCVVWFIGPVWFLYFQRYKKALRGPWDIVELKYDNFS